jgi:hypothetical protein
MADSFNINLTIRVEKKGQKEPVIEETSVFNDKSFGLMAIHAADFYELVSKLRAKK